MAKWRGVARVSSSNELGDDRVDASQSRGLRNNETQVGRACSTESRNSLKRRQMKRRGGFVLPCERNERSGERSRRRWRIIIARTSTLKSFLRASRVIKSRAGSLAQHPPRIPFDGLLFLFVVNSFLVPDSNPFFFSATPLPFTFRVPSVVDLRKRRRTQEDGERRRNIVAPPQ